MQNTPASPVGLALSKSVDAEMLMFDLKQALHAAN